MTGNISRVPSPQAPLRVIILPYLKSEHLRTQLPSVCQLTFGFLLLVRAFGSPSRFAVLEEGEDAFVQQLDARALGKSRAAGLLGITGSSSHVELLGSHLRMGVDRFV